MLLVVAEHFGSRPARFGYEGGAPFALGAAFYHKTTKGRKVLQMTTSYLKGVLCAATSALLFSGCIGDDEALYPDLPSGDLDWAAESPEVLRAQYEIVNGTPYHNLEYTGVVEIQHWSNGLGRYQTLCSGTLMTNRHVVTAEHCLDTWPLYVKMGSQRKRVVDYVGRPDIDIAALKLDSPMLMWNWRSTQFAGGYPRLNTTDYWRSLYQGTDAALDGAYLFVAGYGGDSGELKYAVLETRFEPAGTGICYYNPCGWVHTLKNAAGQLQESGDSGGPGLTFWWAEISPLAYVQSHCNSGRTFCYSASPQNFRIWLATTIITLGF